MTENTFRIVVDARELVKVTTGIGRFLRIFLKEIVRLKPKVHFILIGNQHTCFPDFININPQFFTTIVLNERNTIWFDQITISSIINKEKADLFFSPYYKKPFFFHKTPSIISIFDLTYLVIKPYKDNIKSIYYIPYIRFNWVGWKIDFKRPKHTN